MVDIFNYNILCDKCDEKMHNSLLSRNGFNLRVKKCDSCGKVIVHPEDKAEYEDFMRLKKKEYEVKMRMVGNSYAVSIPREIVDFMKDQEKIINNMVKLSFQDAGRLSLMFNTPECQEEESRVVKSREVKIISGNKPVLHAKEFSDSAHPERNKTEVIKNGKKVNLKKEKNKNE